MKKSVIQWKTFKYIALQLQIQQQRLQKLMLFSSQMQIKIYHRN